jgi:hypothetical protein
MVHNVMREMSQNNPMARGLWFIVEYPIWQIQPGLQMPRVGSKRLKNSSFCSGWSDEVKLGVGTINYTTDFGFYVVLLRYTVQLCIEIGRDMPDTVLIKTYNFPTGGETASNGVACGDGNSCDHLCSAFHIRSHTWTD